MTKVLKQKPQTLRALLAAHQRDLEAQIRLHADDRAPQTAQLRSALAKVNAALDRLAVYAAEGDTEEDDGSDNATEGDAVEDDTIEDEDDAVDDLEEAVDDEFEEENVSDEDFDEDDGLEFEEDEPEPGSPEAARDAVKMNNRMRRQIGDPAADFLDDYAFLLHKKVTQFFKELDRKALMLGDEDSEDGETSLRERLREEVGRRGIQALEPVFDEWRGMVIKNILKGVTSYFQPPKAEPSEEAPEAEPEAEEASEAITEATAGPLVRAERVTSIMRPATMTRVVLN